MIGFEMWIAAMFFMTWIPAKWKRRIVGYGALADISVHLILQSIWGGDAEGRLGMLFGGILINLTMHTYRKVCGYERVVARRWVRFNGVLTK